VKFMKGMSTEFKVGAFALLVILLLAWATIRVGDKTSIAGGAYDLKVVFANATGLKLKAPVELAGVQVGVVKDIELLDSREAQVTLGLSKKVRLPDDSTAVLRTRGFLGETYVELVPGTIGNPTLEEGNEIPYAFRTGDINTLVGQFNQIADDIKAVTGSLRTMIGDDETSPINRIVMNLEDFSQSIRDITVRNSENVDRISENLAAMTEQLRHLIAQGEADVQESMERIASITRKIDEGKGTVGRLVNDEETVEKLNQAIDSLNDTLGSYRRLEAEIGYHMEFMAKSHDFKNYVDLTLRPSPDKGFMIGIVSDPDPDPTFVVRETDVTVGNNTTRVSTTTGTIDRNKLRWTAQLMKSFYDFTIRGGLIESTGGVGMDYVVGPAKIKFDAFDFETRYGQRPHLKAYADINVTRNFFLTAGADDFISKNNRDFFFGAGFRFVDEDIKTVGGMGASIIK